MGGRLEERGVERGGRLEGGVRGVGRLEERGVRGGGRLEGGG